MAFTEPAQVNDIGTTFQVTVYDSTSTGDSTVADISTATTKQMIFSKPDGTTLTKTAVFGTDGSNGVVEYVSVDGDLNMAGTWHLQVNGELMWAISECMTIYKIGVLCLGI